MNDDKRAELLMDHYKDTFEHILFHWKARNRLFLFILTLLAAMTVDAAKPGSLTDAANAYLSKTLPVEAKTGVQSQPTRLTVDFSAVGALCWFVLLCLVIQYYQRSILVDRQYNYIGELENQLCSLLGGDFVTREGKAYRSATGVYHPQQSGGRPLFLEAVGPLYVWVFPCLLCGFVVVRLWLAGWHWVEWVCWLNLGLGVAIVAYSILYMRWVKFRK